MAVKIRKHRGGWWLFVDHKGARKAKRIGEGEAARKAAGVAAEQVAARLALGDLSYFEPPAPPAEPAPVVVFQAYAERWLESHAGLRCKPSTMENYRRFLRRHWFPHLGALPLPDVTRERIRLALGALAKTHRASTIRGCSLVALRACLSEPSRTA